ncbi:MAG: hypothetical protein N3H30_01575 [Candidatus Micrarchaeota archaeon]|nr:hypothetical protein [Candidatus Micrarchaeota archaeon]
MGEESSLDAKTSVEAGGPAAPATEQQGERKNAFMELTESMKQKRQLLLSKIERIKGLRDQLAGANKSSVRALKKKKEYLEFKVSTEAITLDKERQLMKSIKGLEEEIKSAEGKEGARKEILAEIKELDSDIEKLKNELDEMKLELIKLREERKKRRAEVRKRREEREQRPHAPQFKKEEFVVNLEDIVVIKKKDESQ